jgi:predicted permease
VLALSTLATLVAAMLCGMAPAFQSTRTDITQALKYQRGSGRLSRWRMQDFLVGGQVALSMILLIGSLLVASSLRKTLDIPIGFDPENAAGLAVDLALEGYDPARAANFRRDLLERVRALPGVESAALAGALPLALDGVREPVYVEGEPVPTREATPVAGLFYAGEGYFHTMRTRLEAGREFEERDETANVAIVNRAFAERLLPNRSPLGARFKLDDGPWREVVGVVQDGKYTWVNEDPLPVAYLPVAQATGFTTIVARSAGDSSGLLQQLRTTTLSLDPSLSIFYDGPLTRRVDLQLFPARFLASSLGSFGIVAILLVGAGLYGTLAYAVSQHTKEIGIRLALGAAPSSVVRTVTARAASLAAAGMLLGVAGGLALGKLFAAVLYGIDPYDPLTIALAVAVMTGVGLVACWIPVRRATKVDPLVALRAD